MAITQEQEYAIGGEISEDGLNLILDLLDLLDEYVELVESLENHLVS